MKSMPTFFYIMMRLRFIVLIMILFLFLISTVSCNFVAKEEEGNENDASLEQTQVALSVEQTLTAQQNAGANATIAAQQATIQAQAALGTAQAQQPQPPQQTAPPVVIQETPAAPPAQPPQPPAPGDLDQMMKSAQILLFEDMVFDPSEYRYVQRTLDAMGLRYKDDGSAIGWLKNDLLAGSPAGKPWDLVIMAIESRGQVSGEYFDYLSDVLNQGTAVILEAWHLDAISEGTISPILNKCGVMVYPYFPKSSSINDVVLWPLPAAAQHPVMNQPNSGMSFTKARDKWIYSGDLGSLMALTGHGDALFLIGKDAEDEYKDGALTVCMGGQLILQTFSSHSFPYDKMYPLWENYIYNALRTHFSGG